MRLYNSKKFHIILEKLRKVPRYGFKASFLETVFEAFGRCVELFTVGFAFRVAVTRYEPRE